MSYIEIKMTTYKLCRTCIKSTGFVQPSAAHALKATQLPLKKTYHTLLRMPCISRSKHSNYNYGHHKKTVASTKNDYMRAFEKVCSSCIRIHSATQFPIMPCVSAHAFGTSAHNYYSTTQFTSSDTIFSLSSGHGKCGVAVIRASGPGVGNMLKEIARFKKPPSKRKAYVRRLVDPDTNLGIDRGLVLWFPGPASFTGEDCVEFQVHGGPAVVAALLSALDRLPGCRQADPGEFTKRAFTNGKLDLTEVEGLGDLIHAETEAQRRQALRQMEGDLSALYARWRAAIIKCVANIEAYIDFSEDQNIESDVVESVCTSVSQLHSDILNHLNDNRQGERLREGVQVAIIGKPNVGKSSLLNVISQRPAAIVTPIAGTTRDVIESSVNIGGFPVLLSDTAGLRHTDNEIEKEGVRRALNRAHNTDIRVLVVDMEVCRDLLGTSSDIKSFVKEQLSDLYTLDEHDVNKEITNVENLSNLERNENQNAFTRVQYGSSLTNQEIMEYEHQGESHLAKHFNQENLIVVFNKSDLLSKRTLSSIKDTFSDKDVHSCFISCVDGDGIGEFLATLQGKVELIMASASNMFNVFRKHSRIVSTGDDSSFCRNLFWCGNPLVGHPSLTQVRHRSHLNKCLHRLTGFTSRIEGNDHVLAAHELRKALREIGAITGQITSEDILDVIFKDFCIGK